MTLYSVFDRSDRQDAPAVVPEKFSWFAAILPPVFLIANRLWLWTFGYIAALVVVAALGALLGGAAGFWTYVLLAALLGFEAASLRRWGLERAGWTYRTELIAPAADLAQVAWLKRKVAA